MEYVIAVLVMMGYSPAEHTRCHHYRRAAQLAAVIETVHDRLQPGLPQSVTKDLVGAVALNESSGVWGTIGPGGEIGYMQIHPEGRGKTLCPDLNVRTPEGNVECGIRLLVAAQEPQCNTDPTTWLGHYNGWRACKPTGYGRRVMAKVAAAGRARRVHDVWVSVVRFARKVQAFAALASRRPDVVAVTREDEPQS